MRCALRVITIILLCTCPVLPLAAQASPSIAVSANPVRAAPVTLHWPSVGGIARVEIFALTGAPVTSVTLTAPDPGSWIWDLTTADGRPATNGGYFIVITLGDNSRLGRRLLVAR
jgi:hypothetical protein